MGSVARPNTHLTRASRTTWVSTVHPMLTAHWPRYTTLTGPNMRSHAQRGWTTPAEPMDVPMCCQKNFRGKTARNMFRNKRASSAKRPRIKTVDHELHPLDRIFHSAQFS